MGKIPGAITRLMSQGTMSRLFFFAIVIGVSYWFFDLIKPFLMPVFWATVMAIVFQPISKWVCMKTGGRENLAATITLLFITLVVVLPFTLVIFAVINEASSLIYRINAGELDPLLIVNWFESKIPEVELFATDYGVDFNEVRNNVLQAVSTATQWIGNQAVKVGQNIIGSSIQFFLMLYLLWFFLRDGIAMKNTVLKALPLGNREENLLFDRFATVSRATLKGTLIVAVVQGTMGGLLFWAVGVSSPLFWGVVMTFLSLLPIGGSAIVWVPTAIVFAIQDDWGRAIALVIFGGLAIGLVDNLLRPILVGRDTKMPDYIVLLATLGGVASFGLAGFIIGPVVAALFLSVWELMMHDFDDDDTVTTAD